MKKIRFPLAALLAACIALPAVAAGPAEPNEPEMQLTPAERNAVIDSLAAELQARYVFPDTAKRLEKLLRERQRSGAFDKLASAREFAKSLSKLLAEEANDRHLHVFYSAEKLPTDLKDPFEGTGMTLAHYYNRVNYGIEKVERMEGNIGYLKLNFFAPAQYTGAALASAMTLVNGTDALIIDLRDNMGGQPETVAQLESYFFNKATYMNGIYYRTDDAVQQYWTDSSVPGPRYAADKPVYILTSHRTFSGGEDMSYSMQAQKRATLVGETTGGGANPGEGRRLGDHFSAFISRGRAINPITKANWERVGVKPDVAVTAADALRTARLLALKAVVAKLPDADERAEVERLIREASAGAD